MLSGAAVLAVAVALAAAAGGASAQDCVGMPNNTLTNFLVPGVVMYWGPTDDNTGTCLGMSREGVAVSNWWMGFGPSGSDGMVGLGQPVVFPFSGMAAPTPLVLESDAAAQPDPTTGYAIHSVSSMGMGTANVSAVYARRDLLPQGRKAIMFAMRDSSWPSSHQTTTRSAYCADFDNPAASYEITSIRRANIAACNFAGTTGLSTGSTTADPTTGSTTAVASSTTAAASTAAATTAGTNGTTTATGAVPPTPTPSPAPSSTESAASRQAVVASILLAGAALALITLA